MTSRLRDDTKYKTSVVVIVYSEAITAAVRSTERREEETSMSRQTATDGLADPIELPGRIGSQVDGEGQLDIVQSDVQRAA